MKYFLSINFFILFGSIVAFSTNNVPEPAYHAKKIYNVPVIDGDPGDVCWDSAVWAPIDQVWIGAPTSPDDYSGAYKVLWTPNRLYILMKFTRSIINDNYAGPCDGNIYNFDCAEIFIDENNSGGNYLNTYKAFAYHLMTTGDVCAIGPSGTFEPHNTDMTFKFYNSGNNIYYWEVELKVFGDKYVYGGHNMPVILTSGKHLGFSVAYNTNDGGLTRKNMFGSHYLPGPDKNTSYKNASDFGDLFLNGDSAININTFPVRTIKDEFHCYPNPVNKEINIYLENRSTGKLKVQIFNILGEELKKFEITKNQSILNKKIDLSDLPKGIYIMKIGSGQKHYINKITL